MRKDLIIGLSVSVLVHYSVLFLTNTRPAPEKHAVDTADVLKIEMPRFPGRTGEEGE